MALAPNSKLSPLTKSTPSQEEANKKLTACEEDLSRCTKVQGPSSAVLKIPCLGRPMKLGMLYDCRTERVIIPEPSFWKHSGIPVTTNKKASTFEIITDDTPDNKMRLFDIKDEMKLSLLCGLVSVEGSAKYLNDSVAPKNVVRIALKHSLKTVFQELDLNEMIEHHAEEFDDATHVITGIQYGVNSIFKFERDVLAEEDKKKVERALDEVIQKAIKKNASDCKILTSEDERKSENFKCTFYGDVCFRTNPTTIEEAITVCKDLPRLIKSTDGDVNGVPVMAFIHPLPTQTTHAGVNSDVTEKIVSLLKAYSLVQLITNNLKTIQLVEEIPGIRQQLDNFTSLVTGHVTNFKQKLKTSIPRMRDGKDRGSLLKYLGKVEESPFSCKKLHHFIDSKGKELSCLEKHLEQLKPFLFVDDSNVLKEITKKYKYVIIFHLGSIAKESHSYLTLLSKSFQSFQDDKDHDDNDDDIDHDNDSDSDNDDDDVDDYEWFNDDGITENLERSTNIFSMFAITNQKDINLKCIISTSTKHLRETPGNISLYRNGKKSKFKPPSRPGIPILTRSSECEIGFKWDKPKSSSEPVIRYKIKCIPAEAKDEQCEFSRMTTDDSPQISITQLVPNTAYRFQVAAMCEVGIGEFSDWSLPIRTLALPSLGARIFKDCDVIKVGKKNENTWYQLPLKNTYKDKVARLGKFDIFNQIPGKSHKKIILLVGATGSGKTTLINGMVNYMLGVRMEDQFRFQLITENFNKTQAESQTSAITAYTIYWQDGSKVPFTLTIIDTPGFGDTTGIEQDNRITDQIRTFFQMRDKNAIDQLDAIGFVAPASEARLTIAQKYVFDSILAIFGKDIAKNIFMMLTFADGSPPPILDALREHKMPYKKYFKFNNSVFTLTSKNSGSEFDTLYWKLATNSFKEFFDRLLQVRPISLTLTREVLDERRRLTVTIEGFQNRISAGVTHLETMRKHLLVIEQLSAEKNANKDFMRVVLVPKAKKVFFEDPNRYVTNCVKCHVTCHAHCAYANDADKYRCSAMDGAGQDAHCRICKDKCHWAEHYNKNFTFEHYEENEEITLDGLKVKYDMANEGLTEKDRLIAGLANKYLQVQLEVLKDVETVRKSLARLDEIAMKPNPLTTVEYIEILIENAKQDKNITGKAQRIAQLEAARERAILIKQMIDKNKCYDPFKVVKEKIIAECTGTDMVERVKQYLNIKYTPEEIEDVKNSARFYTPLVNMSLSAFKTIRGKF